MRGEQTDQLFEPGDGQVAYYSDGGILDNKPFTAAIKAIFSPGGQPQGGPGALLRGAGPSDSGRGGKGDAARRARSSAGASESRLRHSEARQHSSRSRGRARPRSANKGVRAILDGLESLINQRYFPKVAGMEEAEYRRFLRGQAQFEGYRLQKVDKLKARLRRTVQVALPQSPGAVRAFADEIRTDGPKSSR